MKRKIVRLAALGLALLLFATGCGKSGLSEIPPTDIAMQTVTQESQGDVLTLRFQVPNDWTLKSPEAYAIYAVNETAYQEGERFAEEELAYVLVIENYNYIDGDPASPVSDDAKAAFHELFQGDPEKYKAYLNANVGAAILGEQLADSAGQFDTLSPGEAVQGYFDLLTTSAEQQNQAGDANYLTSFSCMYYDGKNGKIAEVRYTFTYEDATYGGVYYIREDIPYQVWGGFDETVALSSGDVALYVADSLEIIKEAS